MDARPELYSGGMRLFCYARPVTSRGHLQVISTAPRPSIYSCQFPLIGVAETKVPGLTLETPQAED